MRVLVLVRHGESVWNKEGRFTGWTDVGLTGSGEAEARAAGRALRERGFAFDLAFTSLLRRAVETLRIILEELGQEVPVRRDWRLNERHYGALQGLSKEEMRARHGEEQVRRWRRGYDVRPPPLTRDDPRWPGNDPRYRPFGPGAWPLTESLKDTVARFLPCWRDEIAPALREGKRVLIVAHGNSLRALVKHLDRLSSEEITRVNIPTGIPLVYELGESLEPLRHYYLASEEEVREALARARRG